MSRWTDPGLREFAARSRMTPARALRDLKRTEAVIRNAAAPEERRRQYRLARQAEGGRDA
jgi:hypothetical protein